MQRPNCTQSSLYIFTWVYLFLLFEGRLQYVILTEKQVELYIQMLIIQQICMINFKGQLEHLFMKISTYISRKIDGKK